MGDGGGSSSPTGEVGLERSTVDDGEVGVIAGSDDLCREKRPLLPDLTDPASDLSPDSPFDIRAEFLGLSVLPEEPGILDLRALNDLVESLVSDLLNEGYDWRPSGVRSPVLCGLDELPPSLDVWFPIVAVSGVKNGTLRGEDSAG